MAIKSTGHSSTSSEQIIAATHRYECIDRAIDGVEEADMPDSFCYYRVEKLDDVNHAYRYSGSLLRTATPRLCGFVSETG